MATKKHASTSKKDDSTSSLTTDLKCQLNEYTSDLLKISEQQLEELQSKVSNDLDNLLDRYLNRLSTLETAEQCTLQDIREDGFELHHTNSEAPLFISLRQRMKEYHDQTASQRQLLAELWEQWERIQLDIMCLAVEVYGKDIVENRETTVEEVRTALEKAQNMHEKTFGQKEEKNEQLSLVENKIEALSQQFVGESQQHLKDIEFGRRKHIQAVTVALQVLSTE